MNPHITCEEAFADQPMVCAESQPVFYMREIDAEELAGLLEKGNLPAGCIIPIKNIRSLSDFVFSAGYGR